MCIEFIRFSLCNIRNCRIFLNDLTVSHLICSFFSEMHKIRSPMIEVLSNLTSSQPEKSHVFIAPKISNPLVRKFVQFSERIPCLRFRGMRKKTSEAEAVLLDGSACVDANQFFVRRCFQGCSTKYRWSSNNLRNTVKWEIHLCYHVRLAGQCNFCLETFSCLEFQRERSSVEFFRRPTLYSLHSLKYIFIYTYVTYLCTIVVRCFLYM